MRRGVGDAERRQPRRRHRERRADLAAGDVDQVGDDRARRRPRPRPRSGEEQPAGEVALGDDGVQGTVDVRQRVRQRHEARMDALEQRAVDLGGERDQLDPETERRGMVDVDRGDVADALGGDGGEVDPRPERDPGEDAELVRGVDAVDVERRVGLGEAQSLRVGEHVGERQTFGLHPCQDVVAGAVEDPIDPCQPVRRRALANRLDHRDAAGDRGFVLERDAGRLRLRGEVEPMVGEHRLVGGDERLARRQRRPRQHQRRPVAATDHLDDDVDVVAVGEFGRVVDPGEAAGVDAAVAPAIARRHRGDDDPAVGAPFDQSGVGVEQRHDAGPDGAEPGEADAKGSCCVISHRRRRTEIGPWGTV